MDATVADNAERKRFEMPLPGGDMAMIAYQLDTEGRLVLLHTEVPPAYAGQGYGSVLARGAFELIRASDRKVVVKCPFLSAFLGRHPQYNDLIG
jgi:predicted GNAT family acetyltransferase